MKTILFSGYYGFGNLGDEALLAGTLQLLRERAASVRTVVLSADPAQTTADHGVEAVPRWNWREVIASIRQCDLFVSGGGGLIQDATSWRSPLYYLGLMQMARLLRTPTMVYAQGIGPLRHWTNTWLARRAFRSACAITVRDAESAEWLRGHGADADVTVTADPALALRPAPEEDVRALLAEESVEVDRDTVIVALREWGADVNFATLATVEMRKTAERVGARLVLLPMHHPRDVPLAEQVAQGAGDAVAVLSRRLKPSEALGVIVRAGAVLGMRLHALVLGVAAHRPVLGVGYDPKVAAFLDSAGAPTAIDLSKVGSGDVAEAFAHLWERRDAEGRRLAEQLPALRRRAEENVDVLMTVLGE